MSSSEDQNEIALTLKQIHIIIALATIIISGFFTLGVTYQSIVGKIESLEKDRNKDYAALVAAQKAQIEKIRTEYGIHSKQYDKDLAKLQAAAIAQQKGITDNRAEIGILKSKN